MMNRVWAAVEKALGVVSLAALACLVLLPFGQVVLRDVFESPIVGLEEATRWGLIALVFLGLPLLLATDAQIRFPELVAQLPRRLRNIIERLTLLLSSVALGTLVWAGIGSILKNRSTRTPTLDIPFWLFASPFLIGIGLTCVGCAWFALRRAPPPLEGGAPSIQ